MGRFDDDLHLIAAENFVPPTVNSLLRDAGLAGSPRVEQAQAQAIRAWSAASRLTPMMEFSIRSCGFADLLITV